MPRWFPVLVMLAAFASGGCDRSARAPQSMPGPARIALLAGGSGETEADNFLIEDLRGFAGALAARGWKLRAVAGSRDGLLSGSLSATDDHLLRGVRETLSSARRGDEVLLLFHSHGRERETDWGQRSHSIVSEDKDASGNEPGFDLDAIEPALLEARKRGVRVALVDLSCYSGSTQALRGAACTVTLAAPRYVSLCSGRPEERGFTSRFLKLPPPGTPVNLEDQYLEARREDRGSINLPQISSLPTPAEEEWDSFLEQADPLDVFEDLKDLRTGTKPFVASKLLKELDEWISRRRPADLEKARLSDLRSRISARLARALELRAELEAAMPALARDYDDRGLEVEVPERGRLRFSAADLSDLLQKLEEPSGLERAEGYTHAQRLLAAEMLPERGRLLQRYLAQLSGFRRRREAFDSLSRELERAADELFDLERDLYDAWARAAAPAQDPCRDFLL